MSASDETNTNSNDDNQMYSNVKSEEMFVYVEPVYAEQRYKKPKSEVDADKKITSDLEASAVYHNHKNPQVFANAALLLALIPAVICLLVGTYSFNAGWHVFLISILFLVASVIMGAMSVMINNQVAVKTTRATKALVISIVACVLIVGLYVAAYINISNLNMDLNWTLWTALFAK